MGTVLQQAADAGQIISGALSLVIILSARLLWRQVTQQTIDGRTELITGLTALITTVGRAFIDYPEMRKYFYERVGPQRDGDDYERARAIAVSLAGAMDHAAAHFDRMDSATQAAWETYFTDIYNHSPVFREHLEDHKAWYGPRFRDHFGIDHGVPSGHG
jgi:hypothetical protein